MKQTETPIIFIINSGIIGNKNTNNKFNYNNLLSQINELKALQEQTQKQLDLLTDKTQKLFNKLY